MTLETVHGAGMAESSAWPNRLLEIVGGQATTAQIESWVGGCWRRAELIDLLPLEFLPQLPAHGRPIRRYGDSGLLRSQVCFVHAHGPGGVVVHAPAIEASSDNGVSPYVPLHLHQSAHLGVILAGEPHLFIERGVRDETQVERIPLATGHVVAIPAGVAHSFGTPAASFTILTMQARFVAPSAADFARNVIWDGRTLAVASGRKSANEVPALGA